MLVKGATGLSDRWFSAPKALYITHWCRYKIAAFSQTTFSNDLFLHTNLLLSLTFVPKVRINNIPTLIQIMAWRRPGDKPLSEPIMLSSLTHVCVTRPYWVKTFPVNTVVSGDTRPINKWKGLNHCIHHLHLYISYSYFIVNAHRLKMHTTAKIRIIW